MLCDERGRGSRRWEKVNRIRIEDRIDSDHFPVTEKRREEKG